VYESKIFNETLLVGCWYVHEFFKLTVSAVFLVLFNVESVRTAPMMMDEYKNDIEPLDGDLSNKISVLVEGTLIPIPRNFVEKSGLLKTMMENDKDSTEIPVTLSVKQFEWVMLHLIHVE
jgi:hypothetical protein